MSKFTHKDVARIVETAGIEGDIDKNQLFAQYTRQERKQIIRDAPSEIDQQIAAAIQIQTTWRGYHTRSILFSILYPDEPRSASTVSPTYTSPGYSEIRHSINSSRLSSRVQSSVSKEISRVRLSYHNYTDEFLKSNKKEHEQLLTFQGYCVHMIQRWWRNLLPQIRAKRKKSVIEVTIDTQISTVKSDPGIPPSIPEAARILQRTWRRHIDMQVFDYYKQLILFKKKGDPRYMLRCINPKEADLLDSASGIHVRFRLGGERFPPSIYYKIYTHRNVADIGTFAPRNYTKAENKEVQGKILNSNPFQISVDDKEDWYSRCENNGWRLVNERVLKYQNDPITEETSNKKIKVSHSKLARRQDIEKRKKLRKIEWMKKMYSQGMLKANGADADVGELVDSATKSLLQTVHQDGSEAVEDWEVDELLQWTDGLNFDGYVGDWKNFGTSAFEPAKQGDSYHSQRNETSVT